RAFEHIDKPICIVPMDWVYTAGRVFHGDHQAFFARNVWQVFRHEVGYLSLLCQQRAGHETCECQNRFRELHKSSFRFMDAFNASGTCTDCAVTRSAAPVPVRYAANLRVGGLLAGHVTRTYCMPVGRSVSGTSDDPASFSIPGRIACSMAIADFLVMTRISQCCLGQPVQPTRPLFSSCC